MGSLTQLANLVHESTALKRKSDEAKKELLEISKTLGTFDHHIVYNRDDMVYLVKISTNTDLVKSVFIFTDDEDVKNMAINNGFEVQDSSTSSFNCSIL